MGSIKLYVQSWYMMQVLVKTVLLYFLYIAIKVGYDVDVASFVSTLLCVEVNTNWPLIGVLYEVLTN
jgi:hypothetical protein